MGEDVDDRVPSTADLTTVPFPHLRKNMQVLVIEASAKLSPTTGGLIHPTTVIRKFDDDTLGRSPPLQQKFPTPPGICADNK
jgi:hypothetical protein